jgi:hypothetical protein
MAGTKLTSDGNTVFDGFLQLSGGVNSGWVPSILRHDQLSFAWNATVRGGFVGPRPGRFLRPLDFGSDTVLQQRVLGGVFQGASFYEPDNAPEYVVASISGRLFSFSLVGPTSTVKEITPSNQTLTTASFVVPAVDATVTVSVASTANIKANVQVEIAGGTYNVASVVSATELELRNVTGVVGATIPTANAVIFWDVNPALRPQVWFVQAEKWLIVQDGQSVPMLWDGAQTNRSKLTLGQITAGKMMAYVLGRIIKVNTDGKTFSIGDIVYGSSGTSGQQFRDAVLYTKENTYLAGGGFFTVPGGFGDITFIKPVAVLDAALGQGPAQVATNEVLFALNLPTDRATWQVIENPVLSVSQLTNGGKSQASAVNVNGDLLYRSKDGIRSFVLGTREFVQQWANTPVSREMNRILPQDSQSLLRYASGVVFDNRLLMTTSPTHSTRGTYHRGLVALDFDILSSMRDKAPAAYDGLWAGVNTLQILKGDVEEVERCFEFVMTGNGQIQLWEMSRDEIRDNHNIAIRWAIETADFFRKGQGYHEFDDKKLLNGELYVTDVRGRVDFNVFFKPDQHPCWIPWHSWYVCQKETECVTDESNCVTNKVFKPTYKSSMPFGFPTSDCDENTGSPYQIGKSFQVRVEVMGYCKIRGMRLMGILVPQRAFGAPICNTIEEAQA